jgi:hypothetical protein
LQAPYQIFVDRPVWLGRPISRSLASDVQIHFICLTRHTALFLLTFIAFCVLDSIMSYGRSKWAMKVGAFDRRWAFVASQNVYSIVIVVPLHVSHFSAFSKI